MTSLLALRDLTVEFPTSRGRARALDRISFDIQAGEVLGVVGESGAGKSLTGLAIMGLLPSPGRIAGGSVHLAGARIDTLPPERMRRIRGRRIGMIFQDPLTALNPLLRVGRQLTETIRSHFDLTEAEARRRAIVWLERAGIPDATHRFDAWPHALSGGQRQRVVIALALCAEPDLVIADEPATALDVSLQAQIMALLRTLTRENGTAVMLITHDMGIIAETADRVAVMYAGRIAEIGPAAAIIRQATHPYTSGLMSCVPDVASRVDRLRQIDGAMPRLDAIPTGCAFHPRCERALDRCRDEVPPLMNAGATRAACWTHAMEAADG